MNFQFACIRPMAALLALFTRIAFTIVSFSTLLLITISGPTEAQAQPASTGQLETLPGELVVEPPTLENLGFEWFIRGDANRNASVAVSWRKQGSSEWIEGLPMMRIGDERVYAGTQFDVELPPMFAGSIMDLEPDTAYEARFEMSDPDGVTGVASQTVLVRTRPEPMPYAGGRVFHVYPHDHEGDRIEPSFEGLMCAYNFSCSGTDWATAGRPRVRPGDTLLVHAGLYKYNRYEYTTSDVNRTVPLDGTYYLTADGTEDRPIVIKAAGDGEVIFDGDGNYALFNVQAADYNYFEGITFRNSEIAILAGTQFIVGSKGLTVKHSRFEDVGAGVFSNYSGSSNFYIADNWFYGRNDPQRMIGWSDAYLWGQFNGVDGQIHPPAMDSYVAVKVYGPGHVVAYNYIADFHDGINVETYGNPDGTVASGSGIYGPKYPPREYWDRRPVAIDFYNNYITNSHDNPIEIDGSMHNVRVMRNMLINHPSHAFCNQPALGGPIYWIRNIAYNLPGGSTRLTIGSTGAVFYNNTVFSETQGTLQNTHWRNNLFLGQNATPALFNITSYTNYSSSDYNGFFAASDSPSPFTWNSPPMSVLADYPGPGKTPQLESRTFSSLAEYSQATGQDRNSIMLDYSVFRNVPMLDSSDAANLQNVYDASDFDFGLVPGSAPVDKGVHLPNVTDGFSGAAPDLGALEVGGELPHYGPRS
ncbi:MAG: hypothetical protein Q8L20_15420 [Gammaproteobacteria bacterium]|nr:hypothetical protein [Gammaproteobacteria bacterium]